MAIRRATALVVSIGLFAAACGQDSAGESADRLAVGEETRATSAPGEEEFDYSSIDYDAPQAASALDDRFNQSFPPPLIDPDLIVSGGPPPDGIPPIDVPRFVSADAADFITSDSESVIALEINGDARAYPVQVLIWHELVNDVVGDVPVTVAYCPLCNSALAFEREFGDRTLTFGTSGSLYQSALVMYDRQTESLWAHFTGQGVVGHFAGAQLTHVPVQTVSFGAWKAANPDGLVLSTDTGYNRDYGSNPYVGYDEEASRPIGPFFNGEVDPRLLSKARIVGVSDEVGSVAVRFDDLAKRRVIAITEEGRNLVVFYQTGLSSALDEPGIADGREVGQSGVFIAQLGDQKLTFTAAGDGTFVDDQNGETWNIFGESTSGSRLDAVPHLDTFWFAWAAYQPDTVILN